MMMIKLLLIILGALGVWAAQGAGAPVTGADPIDYPAANQPDEEGLDSHDER